MKKCYYQVLDVDRNISQGDLKTAFRKQALKYHPDKNPSPDATQIFQAINQAYSVLSDPQERKWYDDHRQQILSGAEPGSEAANYIIADHLFKYFTPSVFSGQYSDAPGGFYDVFGKLFGTLDQEEDAAVYARMKNPESDDEADEEAYVKLPKFGNSETAEDAVRRFYEEWLDFFSRKKFSFMDKYNPSEGPNRRVKRLIVQENLKERQRERKRMNETVRKLVAWVQKRDPRWQTFQQRKKEMMEKKQEERIKERERFKQEKKELRKQAMQEQAKRIDEAEEERLIQQYEAELAAEKMRRKQKKGAKRGPEEWKAEEDDWVSSKKSAGIPKRKKQWKKAEQEAEKVREELEKSSSEGEEDKVEQEQVEEEEEPDEFLCEACDKSFKSKEQLKNHFESKKHKRMVQEIMKELKLSQQEKQQAGGTPKKGGETAAETEEEKKEEDDPEEEGTTKETPSVPEPGPSKKKNKKKKKQQKMWAQMQADDSAQEDENKPEQQPEAQKQQEKQEKKESQEDSQEEEAKGLIAMPGMEPEEEKVKKEQEEETSATDDKKAAKKKKRKDKKKAKQEGGTGAGGQDEAQWKCNVCKNVFDTRNAMFKHIKAKGHERAK